MIYSILMLVNLVLYAVLFSQTMFYLLAMRNVLNDMSAGSFIETRHLLDKHIGVAIAPIYYSTLATSLLMVIVNFKDLQSVDFITAAIAFILLVIDIRITIKGNKPLNQLFNSWSKEEYPNNWQQFRSAWLKYFAYRQVVIITGFIALLIGAIFK